MNSQEVPNVFPYHKLKNDKLSDVSWIKWWKKNSSLKHFSVNLVLWISKYSWIIHGKGPRQESLKGSSHHALGEDFPSAPFPKRLSESHQTSPICLAHCDVYTWWLSTQVLFLLETWVWVGRTRCPGIWGVSQ